MSKRKSYDYPEKLAKTLFNRLARLETSGLSDESPFYKQAEDYSLKDKYYNFKLGKNGAEVRPITKTQWKSLTKDEQRKTIDMYEGALKAKTSTVSGTKKARENWIDTYMDNNPELFENDTKKGARRRAEEHADFFKNFWETKKDHFAYDPEAWQAFMQNYDINAMVENNISPDRLVEFFNIAKDPRSHKHRIPTMYKGSKNYLE